MLQQRMCASEGALPRMGAADLTSAASGSYASGRDEEAVNPSGCGASGAFAGIGLKKGFQRRNRMYRVIPRNAVRDGFYGA